MSQRGQVVGIEPRDGGTHVVTATTDSHRLATIVLVNEYVGTPLGDLVIAEASKGGVNPFGIPVAEASNVAIPD